MSKEKIYIKLSQSLWTDWIKSHLTTVRTWKARQRAVLNYTVNLRKVAVCVFNNAMLKGVYLIALAGTDGLEPSLRESKSRALPLRYVPIKALRSANRTYLTRKILRVGYLLPEVLLDTQTHKGNFHSSREIRYRIGFFMSSRSELLKI